MQTQWLEPGNVIASQNKVTIVSALIEDGLVDASRCYKVHEIGPCIVLSWPRVGEIWYKYPFKVCSYYVTSILVLTRHGICVYASGALGNDDVWDVVS